MLTFNPKSLIRSRIQSARVRAVSHVLTNPNGCKYLFLLQVLEVFGFRWNSETVQQQGAEGVTII